MKRGRGEQDRRTAEATGRRGERLAGWSLRLKGWTILDRRVRTKAGEVDLVARRGKLVAFVEVGFTPAQVKEAMAMRMPDWSTDGWCLEDAEQRAATTPSTFEMPSRELRGMLQPGDFAKLIFRIAVNDTDESDAFERMWVIIRERHPFGYVGVLDNQPSVIAENDSLWIGTELPFEFRHIIAVDHANAESMSIAATPAPIPWK